MSAHLVPLGSATLLLKAVKKRRTTIAAISGVGRASRLPSEVLHRIERPIALVQSVGSWRPIGSATNAQSAAYPQKADEKKAGSAFDALPAF